MSGEQIVKQETGKQLLDVVVALCPDGRRVDVIGGNPERATDDFAYHYAVYGLEDETGISKWADDIRDLHREDIPLTVDLDGTAVRKKHVGRRIYSKPADDFELNFTLRDLQGGKVVADNMVIVDTATPHARRDGLPELKRVYKRKSIRYLGHKLSKAASAILIES